MSNRNAHAIALAIALFAAIPAGCGGELPPAKEAAPMARAARIAVVDLKRAAVATREGREAQMKLQLLATSLREAAAKKAQKLLAAPADADPDAVKANLDKWQASVTEYGADLSGVDAEVAKQQEKWAKEILERLRAVVADVAEKQGYGLVLDAEATTWVVPADDLTETLIRAYDARRPGGATLPTP